MLTLVNENQYWLSYSNADFRTLKIAYAYFSVENKPSLRDGGELFS